jgi:uncharacterized membrane-anchored protein
VRARDRSWPNSRHEFAPILLGFRVVGTLITDNLTDNLGISLKLTTVVFAVALAATFSVWYASEHTLSIHTITTTKREAFYWSAILFTFALGTAAGDLIAEQLNLGYLTSLVLFASGIAAVYVAWRVFHVNEVLAFWCAYVLTRPLGASTGDLLSQTRKDGGLGFGTVATTVIFLGTILAVVTFLSLTRGTSDSTPASSRQLDRSAAATPSRQRGRISARRP